MKAKEKITMVCTSAVGEKVPLAVVGKPKQPQCWDFCNNRPPIPYTNQADAWFDMKVSKWWIEDAFFRGTSKDMASFRASSSLTTAPPAKVLTSLHQSRCRSSSCCQISPLDYNQWAKVTFTF